MPIFPEALLSKAAIPEGTEGHKHDYSWGWGIIVGRCYIPYFNIYLKAKMVGQIMVE